MNTKSFTIQSLHRSQDLVEAIDNLLIHYKLNSKGISDEFSDEELKNSKNKLVHFLKQLQPIIEQIEDRKSDPLKGLDFGSREFVRSIAGTSNFKFRSRKLKEKIVRLSQLIESSKSPVTEELIQLLDEFRTLLEERISAYQGEIIDEI